MEVETCTNCDCGIGKLETAHLFNGNVVCSACKAKLDKSEKGMMESLPRGYDGGDYATQNELAITRKLGLTINPEATRDQIRRLIDRVNGREIKRPHDGTPATEKQISFARDLGIANPESFSKGQISDEIEIALAQRAPRSRKNVQVIDHSPKCLHCGGTMVRSKTGTHPIMQLIGNLILLVCGILLLWIPIIGIPMIIIALFRSRPRKKVLKCIQCNALSDRA